MRLPALGIVAIIMLTGAMLMPIPIVHVRSDAGHPVTCQRLGTGESIDVAFTHSMYGGLVTETWRADGSTLDRTSMVTENAAAAEYYAWDGNITSVDGGFEVIAPPTRTGQLRIMVDDIGDHRLRIGADTWSLASILDTPVPVAISIEERPLAAWLFNRSC